MIARACATAWAAAVLAACTVLPEPPPSAPASEPSPAAVPASPPAGRPDAAVLHYRCDEDFTFTVSFSDGTATIDAGSHGIETLLRDAGGMTPQQTVYSSTRLKAEFGLEPGGRGARLLYASPALEARCVRE